MTQIQNESQPNKKRSLLSTMVLLAIMVKNSPRKPEEKQAAPVLETLFDDLWTGSELFKLYQKELTEQGYLTPEGDVTPFGQKVSIEATHNAPDYKRIANGNINAAFAMFFESVEALKGHLKNKITPGGKTDMYERVVSARDFITSIVE